MMTVTSAGVVEVSAALQITKDELDHAASDAAIIELVNDKAELLRRSLLNHLKTIGRLDCDADV